jgi:hypothetical protein
MAVVVVVKVAEDKDVVLAGVRSSSIGTGSLIANNIFCVMYV